MKNTLKYLALAAAMLFGFGACVEKAPEYVPADPVGNAEVFFAPTLPTSYNLKGNTGSFTFDVSRVDASNSLTVNLSSSNDAIFSVSPSVSFASGAKTAPVEVTFDPAALAEDTPYKFTVTIGNETTPYGASEYSFTATLPSSWMKFGAGTLYEVAYWNEEEPKMVLWYQDLSDELRICKIEDCFGYETIAAGNAYDVQDYVFYWNTKTNRIYIPVQWMGYANSNGKTWFGDESSFYNLYWAMKNGAGYGAGSMGPGAGQVEGSAEWFEFCDAFRDAYPEDYYPYYDGNGGFYLADQYIAGYPGDASVYLGRYVAGDAWDYYLADGFVRWTDFNDDKHFGASSALYEGYLASMMFSDDDEPALFEQSLRYDADYDFDPEKYDESKDGVITTTYYLKDYFSQDHCLAFIAPIPELLKDGSEISDVENDQKAGFKMMGHDLFVNIKKGVVSFPEDASEEEDLFPTFTIMVNAYLKDAEGNVEYEFGTLQEVFTALEYGKDGYTLDDIYGGYKEDYIGTWSMFSTEDGEEYNYDVEISDEGQDEDGTEWVKITNLSGYHGWHGMVDELYATWSDYVLYVPGQDLENPVEYNGADYTVKVYPADPDTQKYYGQSNTVLAGICTDGALAFVNRYSGVNLSGFYYLLENLGGLTMFGNIYGFPAEGASNGNFRNFYEEFKTGAAIDGVARTASVKFDSVRLVKKSASSAAPARRINVDNFVKEPKQLGGIIIAPVK